MFNPGRESEIEGTNGHSSLHRFGEFTLDPNQRALFRLGKKIHMMPKTFEVLEFLLERADRVVLKNELLEAVWNDAFVEESNLTVQISTLRKIFGQNRNSVVWIETIPKVGYRLNTESDALLAVDQVLLNAAEDLETAQRNAQLTGSSVNDEVVKSSTARSLPLFLGGMAMGIVAISFVFYFVSGGLFGSIQTADAIPDRPLRHHTFKTSQCPRDVSSSVLVPGGCEEAVASFNIASNPNGNWSYGYTPKDDISNFVLFREPMHNNHFYSPEIQADIWRRPEEWHPSILRNTSPMTIVIQDGVVVPPHMFEMHPGPNGERSVLRWTAPVNGHFQAQGQFRGINTNGDTTSDVLVVFNGKEIYFSDNVTEYNLERPFEVTFKAVAGDTVDLSVGFGSNQAYECDSTGVSVHIITISLEDNADRYLY